MKNMILESMYILTGLVAVATGIYALMDREHRKRTGTALFWIIFGFIFIGGKHIPDYVVGGLLVFMGILTLLKRVGSGSQSVAPESYRKAQSDRIGNTIFIPALTIGVVAFATAQFTGLGGLIGLGLGSISALILTLIITRDHPKHAGSEGSRMLQMVGATAILPQLLAALGALFAMAGVGEVISSLMGGVVPEGSRLAGAAVYCIAMAVFTIIMGNAFAAFAVITAGIGIPFVFTLGADPAIAGILGLTAGYCGTLLTPMGANFNIVPAAIMEMNNKNGVIKAQAPVALTMLAIHIMLMYLWAF